MGWWWSSNAEASPSTDSAPRTEAVSHSKPVQQQQQQQNVAPQQPISADSEFEALVASFDGAPPTRPVRNNLTNNITPAPEETSTHYAPSPSGTPSEAPIAMPTDISPEALYPRTMSCRQAFDQAFYCQSLGGKFNDVYRYGELRTCSDNWNAFWFCMRIKSLPDHERGERVRDYYRDRELKIKRERGTSEDIWDIRTEPVKKAFWKDPDEVTEN